MTLSRLPALLCASLCCSLAATAEVWEVEAPTYSASPTRADIDVSEGTWMSLDVSPDGREIVFDLLGDLYRLPIEGGRARALTTGLAWDMQPRYNPAGTHIAFTSDRAGGDNIWVMDVASGEMRQVTYESFRLLNNPAWSPDGQYIAARKHYTTTRSLGTGEIWLYHSRGGEDQHGQALVERPSEVFQKELGEPVFAPDGKSLYFTRDVTPGNTFIYHQDSNGELFQIRKVTLADGEITTVAGGPGGATRPTPSPDGRHLAYVKRVRAVSRLFVMNLETGVERMLYDKLDPDMQETWGVHGLYPNMAWTPDSAEIVFWAGGRLWRIDAASGAHREIPFQVRDTRTVYPAPLFQVEVAPESFDTRMVRFASHSPDGSVAVFESLGRLYLKRGDAAPEQLTDPRDGFDYAPVWAPDGGSLYFLRWSDEGLSSLHHIDARGGQPATLKLPKGQYAELAISSDGMRLALRKLPGNTLLGTAWATDAGVYTVDTATGEHKFVSRRGTDPHFGPDQRIYARERASSSSGRGSETARTTLISMNAEGLDVRELASAAWATDIRLSPDGRHIAWIDGYHIHMAALLATGKPVELDAKQAAFPAIRLSRVGGTYLHWSGDGSAVGWSTGPALKTVAVTDALEEDFEGPGPGLDLSQTVASERPDGRLALVGARIITMNAERQVIEGGTVLIEGNRITALGPESKVAVPEGYQRLDLRGRTLIPGLVDIHAHGPYGRGDIIPRQNWNLLGHLALGVTTLHNPSSNARLAFAAAEYARAGRILGPRIFSTGEIVYGAKSTYFSAIDSLDDALAQVRRLKAQGAISVKNYNQPRREQRQQVIEAARQEGLMTVAEGGSLFHTDMNLIADGITGIEHNLPTLNIYDDVIQLWKQSQAGYTPTLVVTYGGLTAEDYYYQHTEVWKHPILSRFVPPGVLQSRSVRRPMAPEEDYRDDDAAAAARLLLHEGVMVNTGAHGQREGLGNHWEMWSFVRGGFTPMEALSAATINPANYLGMAGDIGSLETGKLADLVVLDANPLEDIHNSDRISHVILNGRVYQAPTLQETLSGESVLSPFYWQGSPEAAIR